LAGAGVGAVSFNTLGTFEVKLPLGIFGGPLDAGAALLIIFSFPAFATASASAAALSLFASAKSAFAPILLRFAVAAAALSS
jgi:hypothetical protein